MQAISRYLPWALLLVSLAVISADKIEAERIHLTPDQQGFCQAHPRATTSTRLQLRTRNHYWIWVSCSDPKDV